MRKPRTQNISITPEARVLRQMRIVHGLTMRQAGLLVNRSDSFISQIENGRMDVPNGERLERLLMAYGGIKIKSFQERVRLSLNQVSQKDELYDLLERMRPDLINRTLKLVRVLMSGDAD